MHVAIETPQKAGYYQYDMGWYRKNLSCLNSVLLWIRCDWYLSQLLYNWLRCVSGIAVSVKLWSSLEKNRKGILYGTEVLVPKLQMFFFPPRVTSDITGLIWRNAFIVKHPRALLS